MNNFPFNNFNNFDPFKMKQMFLLEKELYLAQNKALHPMLNEFDILEPSIAQEKPQPNAQEQQLNQFTIDPKLFENIKMNNKEVVKFLQNLFELPATIEETVEELIQQTPKEEIKELIKEELQKEIIEKNSKPNQLIDTQTINQLLKDNSKIAIDKLFQAISTALKNGNADVSDLKNILSIATTINHNATSNIDSSNNIKELLLLYIPLETPVFDKQIDFKNMFEGQGNLIKSSSLSIMLQTMNFSNILCVLNCESNDILIEIYGNELFPISRFQKVMMEVSKELNLNIGVDFIKINSVIEEKNEQNFKISAQSYIPASALILANGIIKIIFKLDKMV